MLCRLILSFAALAMFAACDSRPMTMSPSSDMSGPPDMATPLGVVKDGVVSGSEVRVLYSVTNDGLRYPRGMWDSKSQRECSRLLLSDGLHCVPAERAQPSIYFVDSACLNRIYFGEIECGPPPLVSEYTGCGRYDMYQATVFTAGPPTYYVMNGMCLRANLTPELLSSALYLRGAKLPPSAFPVLSEARGGG